MLRQLQPREYIISSARPRGHCAVWYVQSSTLESMFITLLQTLGTLTAGRTLENGREQDDCPFQEPVVRELHTTLATR